VELADVAVAESEDERCFLRSTNTLRLGKMEDNFFPPRRTLSRSPPSTNRGTDDGEATAAVIEQRAAGERRREDKRRGGEGRMRTRQR